MKTFSRKLERKKTEISDIVIPEFLTNHEHVTIEQLLGNLSTFILIKLGEEVHQELEYRIKEMN